MKLINPRRPIAFHQSILIVPLASCTLPQSQSRTLERGTAFKTGCRTGLTRAVSSSVCMSRSVSSNRCSFSRRLVSTSFFSVSFWTRSYCVSYDRIDRSNVSSEPHLASCVFTREARWVWVNKYTDAFNPETRWSGGLWQAGLNFQREHSGGWNLAHKSETQEGGYEVAMRHG